MKKILVPTDFSEQADNAMNMACQIAKKNGAEVYALHILDISGYIDYAADSSYSMMGSPPSLVLDEKFMNDLQEGAQEKMEHFIDKYRSNEINIQQKIEFGNAYLFITEEVKNEDIDLIVMGSKGVEDGVEEFFVGSNTEKVVRHAKCPVITVKNRVQLDQIKNIVFASGFTEKESHVSVELKKIQEVFDATLHLVRINTPNNFETTRKAQSLIEQFAKSNELRQYTINFYDDLVEEDGIIYFAQDIEADMIALATHGRSGLMHLLSGSIAEDVVNHAKRPVWTFRLKH